MAGEAEKLLFPCVVISPGKRWLSYVQLNILVSNTKLLNYGMSGSRYVTMTFSETLNNGFLWLWYNIGGVHDLSVIPVETPSMNSKVPLLSPALRKSGPEGLEKIANPGYESEISKEIWETLTFDECIGIWSLMLTFGIYWESPLIACWFRKLFHRKDFPTYSHPKAAKYLSILDEIFTMLPMYHLPISKIKKGYLEPNFMDRLYLGLRGDNPLPPSFRWTLPYGIRDVKWTKEDWLGELSDIEGVYGTLHVLIASPKMAVFGFRSPILYRIPYDSITNNEVVLSNGLIISFRLGGFFLFDGKNNVPVNATFYRWESKHEGDELDMSKFIPDDNNGATNWILSIPRHPAVDNGETTFLIGSERKERKGYLYTMATRSATIHGAVSWSGALASTKTAEGEPIVLLPSFSPETLLTLDIVWLYLNGLEINMSVQDNHPTEEEFKVILSCWDIISWLGIPLNSNFVERYLRFLVATVEYHDMKESVGSVVALLLSMPRSVLNKMRINFDIVHKSSPPSSALGYIDKAFSRIYYPSAPGNIFAAGYGDLKIVEMKDVKGGDIVLIWGVRGSQELLSKELYEYPLHLPVARVTGNIFAERNIAIHFDTGNVSDMEGRHLRRPTGIMYLRR